MASLLPVVKLESSCLKISLKNMAEKIARSLKKQINHPVQKPSPAQQKNHLHSATRPALRLAPKDSPMPKQKPSDQVATLRKQQAELMAKLKEAENKARQEAKEIQQRKNELAGGVALKELEANPSGAFAAGLRDLLLAGLTKAADRALFELPALPKASRAPDAGTAANGEAEALAAPAAKEKSPRRPARDAGQRGR
jgi:hypothetical protein